MENQLKKVYKRATVGGVICFLLMWGLFVFIIPGTDYDSLPYVIKVGLLALTGSVLMMFGIIFGLKICAPVFTKDTSNERMRKFRNNHISIKLIILFTCLFAAYFTLQRLILTVSIVSVWRLTFIGFSSGDVNPFALTSPFWLEPIAGLFIGLIAGLLAVVVIRSIVKNYENKDGSPKFFFRDS